MTTDLTADEPLQGRFDLHAGALRLSLRADLGGCVAGLWHRDTPVLGSVQPESLTGAAQAACWPLLPWANRLGHAHFRFKGREVTTRPNLPGEPHALHGLGWQRPWEIVSHTAQDAVLRQLYPQGGSAPVAKAIGRNAKSVSERAKRLGVRCEVRNIGAMRRWELRRDVNAPSPTAVRLRKPAPVWPRVINQPQACAEPIRTAATRLTVAPPPAERFAVVDAPRVVNAAECRPWAHLVASGAPA